MVAMSTSERWTRRLALVLGAVLLCSIAGLGYLAAGRLEVLSSAIGLVTSWLSYLLLTRKYDRRARVRREPFPPAWEQPLIRQVEFYRLLSEPEQQRFREEVQIFLAETRVTGIGTDVDDTCRVLVAASAIIPVFGFPDWEWDGIGEILIYPNAFDREFRVGRKAGAAIGMVGNDVLDRVMILSKPDLLCGFAVVQDRENVGIHEFAHLLDKADGRIDGVPAVGLCRETIGPWLELVREEMLRIEQGRSSIDRYALTNEAEFFAVTSEYFFGDPVQMQRKHPELYGMLARVYRQDLRGRFKNVLRTIFRPYGRRIGRNKKCPCGSGIKYKKCCLSG